MLPLEAEKSAQLSDNIADTQPNSTQSTGNFQTNTNPQINLSITSAANSPIPGTFLVDNQGKVRFDYVFDGGGYEGELGIFSLAGMSAFIPGTPEFIAEASRRVLSNSTDGHIVISDATEGAKFTGAMPFDGDWDSGEYQGIKTFNMTPGDTFAVMLVPNGTVQSSLQSSYSGNLFPENRPLFSIATANPNDTAHLLQIADITGSGNTFALEDMSPPNSDRDYNDLIFKISGATGNAPLLDTVINPDREWRNTTLGQQLLAEANPPNSDNNPPVVSPTSARTYTELETTISLENLATDAEGDPLTISVQGPVNGTVIFNPLTNKASFKPAPGFSGIASFDFLASDAFGSSTPARVTVNVSDVPLLNLDFVKRNPSLNAGENTELIVLGDFADQKGVVLPDSYLTYTSFNPEVAPIDPTGKVTGLVNGTSILSASRNNLQAVTAVRVGKLPAPTNDAEFNGALAEINGLNVYPKAVTMTAGMGRALLVGIENIIQSPDLKFGSVGTRYFPGNSNLLQVNSDGIITALEEGVTNVTVIHGAAEQVVPVRVSLLAAAGTILGVNGGAVSGSDGSIVMVPPGALAENTAISLTSLSSNALSLQLPDGLQFAGGFNLDLGDESLKLPAQLAIPAPAGLSPGTEILFMRKGSLPDANNIENPTWLIQESGVVDANGIIRTNSPPFPGVLASGEYAMFAWPTALESGVSTLTVGELTELGISQAGKGSLATIARAINLATNFGVQSSFLAASVGLIGIAAVGAQFAATILLLGYLAKYLQSGLKVIAIPQVGLPVVTDAGVELDPEGIPSVTATVNVPTLFPADPFAPPVLQSAEFKLENGDPTVVLTGSNFLNNSNDLGGEFEDLTVSFRVGDKTYPAILMPEKNTDLGENRYKIAVKIPITVPVGESSIVVSRKQKKRFGLGVGDYEIVELESEENIRLAPTCVELALVTERTGDKINVINLKDPLSTVETQTSDKLAVAINIPVGNPNIPSDRPESIAPTNNATRGYVTLRDTGRVSVVDLIALREIDTTPETATVDAISLPSGARPQAIVIDPKDNYAYIADQNRPNIYVLDINPNSATYHTVVQTINVSSPLGLSQLAISSDGRRLFATGSDNNEQTPNRSIYAVNIDPADKPNSGGANTRLWHQQIKVIPTASETEGIAATSDPKKMVFTNGFASVRTISNGEEIKLQDDGKGFGVLEIESDDPLNFSAKVNYAPLSLGVATDYFDVNEAVAVTVTQDGKYAFVAGRNSRANENTREGGNIGIIANPLTPNPQLVAATRPIPKSLTNNLALSSDGKYLIASYPTTNLGGSSYVFDVQEMIKAIENPGNYKLDARDRGVGTVGFATDTERNATQADFARVPIDDINPLVSIAADYEITGGNWINNFDFGIPDGTKRAPIGIGGNPKGLAIASVKNWLELKGPIGNSENDSNPLTPTFEWDIKGKNEECGLPNLDPDKDIHEVNLYVSVFPKEEGLLPGDRWPGLEALTSAQDYNPNRILTAKWSKDTGNWTWNGVSKPGNFEEFTLPPSLMLTAGQKYYWAVEALGENGKQLGTGQPVTGEFKTLLPTVKNSNTFSSVTVLTRGLEPGEPEHSQLIDNQLNGVAKHIYEEGGAVQKYNSATGKWQSVAPEGNDWIFSNAVRSPQYGKPLVLLANWVDEIQPHKLYNSGFAEAAADVLFASMVQLDLEEGGSIGKEGKLYDSTGKLIRNQGAVFNSPLHFVGFGQGAVVNSEIVQRLGTFLPDAGGTNSANRDLQMTTIDPYDYDDNSFSGPFLNIQDPEIKVWNNVTYADNYYQTNGIGNTINGRELSGTNWKSDWNVSLNNLAGFRPDDGEGASHRAALAWYAGTANLNESQFPSENGETIYRRLGDLEQNNIADVTKTWYTPEHTNASFTQGDTKAPWEGIGTGWFDSVLGGGSQLRPYFDGGKKTKNELGDFEDYLKKNRVSVYEDNTYTDRMRGDYAVPTLFNGNFDAVAGRKSAQTIPGWSLFNGSSEDVLQSHLVDWYTIGEEVAKNRANTPGLKDLIGSGYLDAISYDVARPNFALRMGVGGTKKIVHNYFVMPEWGDLRFNLHAPFQNRGGKLKVWLETTPKTDSQGQPIIGTGSHLLKEINLSADPENKLETYASDIDKIGFGRGGFETFHVDSSKLDQFRGQSAKLRFEVEGDTRVYLDDVFFKSSHLEFGNPSEARYSPEEPNNNPYRENLLLEKPQYTASYNRTTKTPNWVSWQVNKSWIGGQRQADDFIADPTLPNGWPQISGSNYENNNGLSLGFNKGHIIPSGDRTRYPKDNIATFLGTNLIPQNADNNLFFSAPNNPAEASAWYNIEQLVTGLAESSKQVYVVAGTYGTNWEPQKKSNALPNDSRYQGLTNSEAFRQQGINIPTWTWKTNLVLEHPSQGVPDVNRNTKIYTFLTPNRAEPSALDWANAGEQGIVHPFYEIGERLQLNRVLSPIKNVTEWRDPNTWLVSLEELENLLKGKNIKLFSNIPGDIRDSLKQNINLPRP
ncbi:DNA/RNA non-specific endonuclease [Tychonema sp. LEGE 07199]|nr:DNA/RNA non-specific endonuclease [Tychonema sp. LEGE 07199]MBE9133702.1 DNA/RNA non-specific endonuclease [Tychonema sp. LEGE 07196]